MLEIIILCVVFYVGYQVGLTLMAWRMKEVILNAAKQAGYDKSQLVKFVEDTDNGLINPKTPNVYKLIVEKTDDILYLFDYEKDAFVCQGGTVEELAKLAKEYKNITYAAVLYDDAVYSFIDGKAEIKT